MKLTRIDHFTIRTADLERSQTFYRTALGLTIGWRPAFPFPGYWLYHGDHALLHLVAFAADEKLGIANGGGGLEDYLGRREGASSGSGALDHIAIRAVGAAALPPGFVALRSRAQGFAS